MFKRLISSKTVWLGSAAALLYSSWPLGYLLDPTVERHSLASELEAAHHPYSWVFVGMDVLAGLCLVVIGIVQLRKTSAVRSLAQHRAVYSYMIFGILVAVAALTPLVCDPTTAQCGPLLHNYRVLVHGFASIGSVIFLLFSLTSVALKAFASRTRHIIQYSLAGLLLAWAVFGLGSIAEMAYHLTGNGLQDFFITVCSLSIVAVVAATELEPAPQPAKT